MKYKNTVLIVEDMNRSKNFYKHVLGLRVLRDFHGRVLLSSNLILQSREVWKDLIHKDDDEVILPHYACELTFEIEDIDDFMNVLYQYNVPLVHPLKEFAWGQRIVRFYDPDGHIIEVGESMKKVIKRCLSQGLTYEEISKAFGLPLDFVKENDLSYHK